MPFDNDSIKIIRNISYDELGVRLIQTSENLFYVGCTGYHVGITFEFIRPISSIV